MRRSYRTPRIRPPKPPKPARPARPSVRELMGLYRQVLTLDQGARLAAMAAAMQWFDKALPYVVMKSQGALSADQAKDYDIALKCRQRGVGTTFNGEKETSFKMALQRYERVCSSLKHMPKVDKYLQILEANKCKMQQKQERLEGRFGNILELVNKAMAPKNGHGQPITLTVGQVSGPYQMDPEASTLTFSRKFVHDLQVRFRQQGLFHVVRELLDPLSRLAALEAEQDANGNYTGRYVLSPKKQLPMILQMLDNFEQFAKTADAPRRLVRAGYVAAPADPNAQKPAKAVRVMKGGKRETIGDGLFMKGSHRGLVYTILSDEKVHTLEELSKAIYPHNPKLWLPAVMEKGTATGRYTVTWLDDKSVQLKFNAPPAAQVGGAS